ncbi:MAG: hypothetical protein R3Y60_03940 [bacterium]
MKKLLLLIGVVATAFSLTACDLPASVTKGTTDKYDSLFENMNHGTRSNKFVFTTEDYDRIENKLEKLEGFIEADSNATMMLLYFNSFFEEFLFVQEQYALIYAYSNCFPNNTEIAADFSNIKTLLLKLDEKRFEYLIAFTKSKFVYTFFPDWDTADYSILTDRDTLYDAEYYELEQKLSTIEIEYNVLLSVTTKDYDALAAKLVEKVEVENKIATKLGYTNYIEYMYEYSLRREYEYSDLSDIRTYSKQNIGQTIISLKESLDNLNLSSEETSKFETLSNGSFWGQEDEFKSLATEMGGDYLSNYNYFWDNGEYYFGDEDSFDAAYCQKTMSQNFTLAYFGSGYYSSLNTVVHEVGHYMAAQEDYKDGSYDNVCLAEFQAQSNEMLLTAYMYNNNSTNKGYYAHAVTELYGGLSVVLASLIVSDFEYEIYNKTNLSASHISSTMANIYADYGVESFMRDSDEYWAATARYATGYYISYGISIIPSMELFFVAIDDFDQAKLDYDIIMKGEDYILPTLETLNYSSPLSSSTLSSLINKCNEFIN